MTDHLANINKLMLGAGFSPPQEIRELPSAGSGRLYYRIVLQKEETILAAFNRDIEENKAWQSYTIHFQKLGFRVPKIIAADQTRTYFLLQDLGDEQLLNLLLEKGEKNVKQYYRQVIEDLFRFQTQGVKGIDFSVAYPTRQFDARSVMWDLNYFKYYFAKTHSVIFNENDLEEDFQRFTNDLLKSRSDYFMYRDFQARNIMIYKGEPWYIDFQGGRKGPLQYDLVSLLYQAKANLSEEFRNELYELYLSQLQKTKPEEVPGFKKSFPLFVMFRIMQVLGAYGFRGIIQRKGHFLSSIPYATRNIRSLLDGHFRGTYPELSKVLENISEIEKYNGIADPSEKLTVEINSFSYKKNGCPLDLTENGGGFVFDCRSLPNPGRIATLRDYTGKQEPVIEYLEGKTEMKAFLESVSRIVYQSIDNYLDRGFTHLQVNFGCTGGKHRSVFSAEKLRSLLESEYNGKIKVILKHTMLND